MGHRFGGRRRRCLGPTRLVWEEPAALKILQLKELQVARPVTPHEIEVLRFSDDLPGGAAEPTTDFKPETN